MAMSLNNLLGKTLERIDIDPEAITRLLIAAKRNIEDAHITAISLENRFDAAYKAIMQLANIALQANGYRTLTNKPGHHMTMIQTLNRTIGLDNQTVIVLDTLRKQRNINDYSGDIIPESTVHECIAYAKKLVTIQHISVSAIFWQS
jgi:hypothetical protein